MVRVDCVSRNYGQKAALKQVSFEVNDGEVLGLLGKNGAGKSTMMNIMTGNLAATQGTIRYDEFDIMEQPLQAKKCFGYLSELPPLYMEMRVERYLNFVYDLKRCTLPRQTHIQKVMRLTHTEQVGSRVIRNLSKGYRQRIGIAQAMIGDPKVLILDEPMVGLDPQQIIEVRDLILDLKQSHTVILSSHILPEIQSVCDRVVVLNEGSLVADDTPEHLSAKLSAASRLRLRVAAPAESVIQLLKTIRDVETFTQQNPQEPGCCELLIEAAQGSDIRRAVFCRLSERQYPILYMALEEMTLESIFLSLTGNG